MTTATALTPETFEQACGSVIRAKFVTPEMIKLATAILKREAKRLKSEPACNWWVEPIIAEIEDSIPNCRDRQVQAVLTVAEQWGEDDFGNRV